MNATVTKSAKKSVNAKTKPAAKAIKPVKKSNVTAAKKTLAAKSKSVVKPIAKKAAPAAKTAKVVATKSPAKSSAKAKSAVKSAPAKTAGAKEKSQVVAKKTSKVVAAPTRKSAKPAELVANKADLRVDQSRANMSADKAAAMFVNTIQKPAVSKASEVATKTSKAIQSVPADGTLLTEAQIMKMGDKDYMNDAQLAFFRDRLQQLERDLLKNAGETTEHLRETVLVPDPADRATIEEEHALELRTRDRERKLLKKVQQSLASLSTGEYGWCEETGEPIGIPRLLARPTATLSLEAQQRRELKQKLYGD